MKVKLNMASEFELINTLFQPLSKGLSADEVGIGDDGAVLNVPENHQLVVVTDTLVCGVHFPEEASAYEIAWKAVAVNLSDLAAMGAKPGFFSLALTIPNNDQAWLADFSKGLADISAQYSVPLIGGDTTKGPLTITVTAQGFVERGRAVRRSTARAGDLICVTNTIGDGALGLHVVQDKLPGLVQDRLSQAQTSHLLQALNHPQPQLAIGEKLSLFANSAIDISDGLLADLNHILEESNKMLSNHEHRLTAKVDLDRIPLSSAAQLYVEQTADWKTIVAGGDDYQLCFTLAPGQLVLAQEMAKKTGVEITEIGEIIYCQAKKMHDSQSIVLSRNGQIYNTEDFKGYLHF
ncbi:MAG: thiamine-phosphate kinase [Thiomicrorhabdus sp.]|nr:thiamine-phosphate kinase [Thiomicrorhabdus sp.]